MKGDVSSLVLKMALFLLIANLLMLLIVPFGTAEWYITVISVVLMGLLIGIIRLIAAVKGRKENHEKENL